jgi:hypothetical protein
MGGAAIERISLRSPSKKNPRRVDQISVCDTPSQKIDRSPHAMIARFTGGLAPAAFARG